MVFNFLKNKSSSAKQEIFNVNRATPEQPVIPQIPKTETAAPLAETTELTKPPETTSVSSTEAAAPTISSTTTSQTPTAEPQKPKSETLNSIEDILAENLSEIYKQLPAAEQQKFRAVGEEIADRIDLMIQQLKATAKTVLDLIRRWLSLIPHVNKFFLEQESKLKTDKIMQIQENYKQKVKEKNIFQEKK